MARLLPKERRITLPELPTPKRATGGDSDGGSAISFASNESWVRFSEYEFVTVEEEVILYPEDLGPPPKPTKIGVLCIQPARGAKAEVVRLEDIVGEAESFIGNAFMLSERESDEFLKQLQQEPPPFPDIYRHIEDQAAPLVMEFHKRFGPLGQMMDDVGYMFTEDDDSRIHVRGVRGEYLGTIEEYFGNRLSRPVSLKAMSEGNLIPLFRALRSFVYEEFSAGLGFADWGRSMIRLKAPNDFSFDLANAMIRRSSPQLSWVGPDLRIIHRAPSLHAAIHLSLIDGKLRGNRKVCKSEFCENIFKPAATHQQYCNRDCANLKRARSFYERRKALLEQGG